MGAAGTSRAGTPGGHAWARLEQLLVEAALQDVVLDDQPRALKELQQVLVAPRQAAVLLGPARRQVAP